MPAGATGITDAGIPEVVAIGQSGGGDFFSPGGAGFGMDFNDFSGISQYAPFLQYGPGKYMNIGDFKAPEKEEGEKEKEKARQPFRDWVKARRRNETPLRDRWQDPEEKKKILRRGGTGLLSLLFPQFRMAQNIYKFGKGMKENPRGVLGALAGNMFMRRLGPNADLFRAGMGLAKGDPTGDVMSNLLVGRGLKAGIGQLAPSLFRKAYAEQGMRGVYATSQLLNALMPMAQKGITGKLGGGG